VHWTSSHEAAPRFAERARAASAQFHLTGVEDLFAIVSGRGTVSILQPLQSRPWGAKDFTIEDPDGNRIVLSGADS
jgi:uncharacterized glyoxalase superfamily protein PhnB